MAPCPSTIDAGVEVSRRLDILVPEQLLDGLETAGLRIKQDLCVQMAKLVGREHNSRAPRETGFDEPRNRSLALWGAVDIYKDSSGRWPITFGAMRLR